MADEISIHLFCHSLGLRLRLLLRLVEVLLEFGLSGHAARDFRLGWCKDVRKPDFPANLPHFSAKYQNFPQRRPGLLRAPPRRL